VCLQAQGLALSRLRHVTALQIDEPLTGGTAANARRRD
jgi:hypothetical protein